MNERLDAAVAALHAQAVDTLRRWIRVPSEKMPAEAGAPFGRPLRDMLTLALEDAKNLGMQTRDFDGYIGEAEIGEGEETMGILAHLDVVPAGTAGRSIPTARSSRTARCTAAARPTTRGRLWRPCSR